MIAQPVSPDGLEVFLRMARDFHAEDGHPLTESGQAAIHDIAHGVALAPAFFLVEAGQKIGFFILTLGYSAENGGTDGFIDDIYILPACRGRGLGRQAVSLAVEKARDCGIRVLLLEVEGPNDRAYWLYRSMGFTDTKRRLLRMDLTE